MVAGGGSFLTLPLLIFLGLPHDAANGTNRLGILIQGAGATAAFRRAEAIPAPLLLRLGLAAVLGSGLGSLAALQVGEAAFLRFLSIVIVLFTLVPLLGGLAARRTAGGKPGGARTRKGKPAGRVGPGLFAAFLGVGFYGGFLQAGVGFLSLAATSRAGFSMVSGNAIKVACVFLFSILSLAVFAVHGAVHWQTGLALGAGTFLGALVGARVTLAAGERVLRIVVSLAALGFAAALWLRA